jgi:hypothetical protein
MPFDFSGMNKSEVQSVYRKANAKRARAKKNREDYLNNKDEFYTWFDWALDEADKYDLKCEFVAREKTVMVEWKFPNGNLWTWREISKSLAKEVKKELGVN